MASSMITGIAIVALSAGGVYAQTTETSPPPATLAPAAGATNVQEFVVTGSRIPSPNLTSVSPIQTVGSKEIALEGTVDVETLLNNLPQVSPDFGQTSTTGTTGGANVDLRDLGSKRTLVLVDGKRLMPGDPLIPVPDINDIPAAMVDRVDVVTGGASAVYGSDAISGVVNFIMKKDFTGVRVDAQYGFDQANNQNSAMDSLLNEGILGNGVPLAGPHGSVVDGFTWNVSLMMGVSSPDDKGNITAYATYVHSDPILSSARDFADCELATISSGTTINGRSNYGTRTCLGSSNSAFGRFISVNPAGGTLPAGTDFANNPNGTKGFVPYGGQYDFNFAPYQYLSREDQRYTAGFFGHYDFNDHAKAYADFMFSDDDSFGQLGPSGLFLGSPTFQINCNNPLMSAAQQTQLCGADAGTAALTSQEIGYRFSDVSGQALPRVFDFNHLAYKVDVGLKGDIGQGWSYDVYGQFGYTRFDETVTGQLVSNLVQQALLVDPATGQCESIATNKNCVPLNIFQVGGITTAQYNSVAGTQVESGFTQEQIVEGTITGDLGQYGIKSPFSTDGVGVAFGADYRRESLGLQVDPITQVGGFAGSGGPTNPAAGAFDVKELYTEVRAPLVQDQPFFKSLEFDGGYRYSHYNTAAGDTNTYKLALDWAPTQDILFRGSFNRAVRAPNAVELFTPRSPGLFTGADPCAAKVILPGSSLYAGCVASGATPAQLAAGSIPQCPAGQCGAEIGGNPTLKPESADTYGAGVVLTPRFMPGFSLSVDYFKIKVNNAITAGYGGAGSEVGQCVSTANPFYCGLIHRDPVLGSIWANGGLVDEYNVNSGALETSGFDFDMNYRLKFSDLGVGDWGGLSFNFVGTYTEHLITTPVSGPLSVGSFDCAGLYGAVCGTPAPKWRSKLRITWTPSNLPITLSGQWRYIGGVGLDINQSNPLLQGGDSCCFDTVPSEAHIQAYNYFDFAGTWRVKDRYTFRAGVNNVFDVGPPLIDTGNLGLSVLPFGNGNTYPNLYDSLGREFFFGVTADF
jgi:iron complex outermembrane receptor protein